MGSSGRLTGLEYCMTQPMLSAAGQKRSDPLNFRSANSLTAMCCTVTRCLSSDQKYAKIAFMSDKL